MQKFNRHEKLTQQIVRKELELHVEQSTGKVLIEIVKSEELKYSHIQGAERKLDYLAVKIDHLEKDLKDLTLQIEELNE